MASVIVTALTVGPWVAIVCLLIMHLRLARRLRDLQADQTADTLGQVPADSPVRHLRVVADEERTS